MREVDVDKLLDMIKNEDEEHLEEIIGGYGEEEQFDYLKMAIWIKNKIYIKPEQKEKLKEAIYLEDEYDPDIIAVFISALLDKDEIKTLINGKNNLESEIYTVFIKTTGEIEQYLTDEKIKELGLDSKDIYKLIIETGKIEQYLTTENIRGWGLDSSQICELIRKTGKIEKYLTTENIKKLGLDSSQIFELISETGKIEKYLTTENIKKWGLDSYQVCELIVKTGKIEKYLTPENIRKWGLIPDIAFQFINETSNDDNFQFIYNMGFDRTEIKDCKLIYKYLDYFLEIEKQTEKKDIIERMYKKNNDIVKVNFEILDNKYLQALGEDKINQISCYPEYVEKILNLSETELNLLGKCLEIYEKNNETEDWTPLCERILKNIGTYSRLLETIEDIDQLSVQDIDDLIIILLQENYLDIECIEDVRNFESIKQKKCDEMFKNGNIEEKINAICISKFGQSKSETEELIKKYAEGIEYIKDNDLQYYIRAVDELLSINDPEILNHIFNEVEPVQNVNSILMERNLKNEYGKLYNDGLFSIIQAQKCESLGDNIYEVPTDENGNITNFNMIITSIAAFFTNKSENFYEDWNRPAIGSQHFCASYIRRDMLGKANIWHFCYGFSNITDDSLMLSGSRDIFSSDSEFVSKAECTEERYLSPDQQINCTKEYNEMDFRRIQNGKKKQPDYIVVFRENGEIFNIDEAKMASEQFKKATGKALPIVIVDQDKCLETERRLVIEMIEEFNISPSKEKADLICQKIRNNQQTNIEFVSDIDISYIQEYDKKDDKRTVTIDELNEIFVLIDPKDREELLKKFKAFCICKKIMEKQRGEKEANGDENGEICK